MYPVRRSDGNRGLVRDDAMFGPRLVDVNAELSADAASGAGSFCDSHLLEHKNSLVDFGQLLAEMGNQCVKGDLVQHDATPSEKHVIIMVWGTTQGTPRPSTALCHRTRGKSIQ